MMLIGNKHRTGAAKIYGTHYERGKGTKYLDFCKACVWAIGVEAPLKVYFEPRRKDQKTPWDDTDVWSFINATGSRSASERPLLMNPWSVEFYVQITDDAVPVDIVKKFYEVAGMRCGLGVYGPTFGRFEVTRWEVQ